MVRFRKGTIVETTQGKIGEIFEPEGFVIKNKDNTTVSEVFESWDVCEAYRMEINETYKTERVPCLVKLGKNFYPIYSKNLKYIPTIYFNFRDFNGKSIILRQNQTTGLILKKFLDKANMIYFMYSSEEELNKNQSYNDDITNGVCCKNYNLDMNEFFSDESN